MGPRLNQEPALLVNVLGSEKKNKHANNTLNPQDTQGTMQQSEP